MPSSPEADSSESTPFSRTGAAVGVLALLLIALPVLLRVLLTPDDVATVLRALGGALFLLTVLAAASLFLGRYIDRHLKHQQKILFEVVFVGLITLAYCVQLAAHIAQESGPYATERIAIAAVSVALGMILLAVLVYEWVRLRAAD
jgi:hypothetical protein